MNIQITIGSFFLAMAVLLGIVFLAITEMKPAKKFIVSLAVLLLVASVSDYAFGGEPA